MSTPLKAFIALSISLIVSSLIPVVSRVYVKQTPPMFILFLRFFIASICFLPFIIKIRVWKKKNFRELMTVSVFATVNTAFFIWGIQYTTASASQIIYAAMPVLVVLIDTYIKKIRHPIHQVSGVVVGLLGIVFIVYRSFIENGTTITGGLIGNIAVIVAMSGWLIYLYRSKTLSKQFSPMEIGGMSAVVSMFIAFFLMLSEVVFQNAKIVINGEIIIAGLYLGIFGTFLFYLFYQYAIKYTSALNVSLSSYLPPITTLVLARIFLDEQITYNFIYGSAFVFAGIFLTTTVTAYKRRK